MQKVYKYRVYPNKSQSKIIDNHLEICRELYNKTLHTKIDLYENGKKSIGLYELQRQLTQWKKDNPNLKNVHSQVLQTTQEKVTLAFQGFFRRLKAGDTPGFPKFKEPGRLRSLIYPQAGFKLFDKHIHLSKIGKIKVVFHRRIVGKIARLSLVKYPSGKYYVCITAEIPVIPKTTSTNKSVGIDLGCKHFAVLSDGQVFDSPKLLKKAQKKFDRLESKGKSTVLLHERIANRRHDFLHKLANELVRRYDLISVEDLNVNDMVKKGKSFSKKFRQAILDNGWSTFIGLLKYKAVIAGKQIILVDPAFTSQMCSRCGLCKKLELSERTYYCDSCGLLIDRDQNASLNILRLGMQSLSENL